MRELANAIGNMVIFILLSGLVLLATASFSANYTLPDDSLKPYTKNYSTPPPPAANPAQWSNAYWEAKAATRDARNAQYRTP